MAVAPSFDLLPWLAQWYRFETNSLNKPSLDRLMLYRFFAISLAALFLSLSGPAGATITETLWKTGMTEADIELMSKTAATLYRDGPPKVGQTATWENAETGAKGSVKLVAFKNNCAQLQHILFTDRRPDEPQEFNFGQCKTGNGGWILTP